ncbi:MAG: cysteine--tRNA ligase [Nitrososphaerota archaeon]|nr:cysteine--tRNA ligase [Nitrososphaerales archaeon]MDW8044806.1 cysteine--tRNA ligase [Nitrososphaerota archaeon]
MVLKLYNTLTRTKEEFKPLNPPLVRMYACGPTVYQRPHIGNLRSFIAWDILRRYLKYKGYQVYLCQNITDVDDKTIKGAREEGVSLREFTDRYIKAFFEDLDRLRIERAEVYPRATEHIDDMVRLVKKLIDKGYAYKGDDGSIYYDVSKFKDYGKLSGIRMDESKARSRIKADEYSKEEVRDFALWKGWDEADGDVYWDTELGRGRPGWHIECSAMSMRYLGESFDIHAGGVDLIFPHHENEIAQSEAATGKPFVRYWIHCEHLIVRGQKMSKSLGNYYTLQDLLDKGYSPLGVRYLLLSTHYRAQLNFTEEGLKQAERSVERLNEFMRRIKTIHPTGEYNEDIHRAVLEAEKKFEEALDDDLNMPLALSVIFDLVRRVNRAIDEGSISQRNLDEVKELMMKFDRVLDIMEREREDEELPEEVLKMIELREEARRRKDWETADRLRNQLLERGIILEDTPEGVKWKRRVSR